jgi:hypothetical protein
MLGRNPLPNLDNPFVPIQGAILEPVLDAERSLEGLVGELNKEVLNLQVLYSVEQLWYVVRQTANIGRQGTEFTADVLEDTRDRLKDYLSNLFSSEWFPQVYEKFPPSRVGEFILKLVIGLLESLGMVGTMFSGLGSRALSKVAEGAQYFAESDLAQVAQNIEETYAKITDLRGQVALACNGLGRTYLAATDLMSGVILFSREADMAAMRSRVQALTSFGNLSIDKLRSMMDLDYQGEAPEILQQVRSEMLIYLTSLRKGKRDFLAANDPGIRVLRSHINSLLSGGEAAALQALSNGVINAQPVVSKQSKQHIGLLYLAQADFMTLLSELNAHGKDHSGSPGVDRLLGISTPRSGLPYPFLRSIYSGNLDCDIKECYLALTPSRIDFQPILIEANDPLYALNVVSHVLTDTGASLETRLYDLHHQQQLLAALPVYSEGQFRQRVTLTVQASLEQLGTPDFRGYLEQYNGVVTAAAAHCQETKRLYDFILQSNTGLGLYALGKIVSAAKS